MDPDAFAASFFKRDPRRDDGANGGDAPTHTAAAYAGRPRELGRIEELFQAYGIRCYTAAKITVSTLLGMKEEELDEMMKNVSQVFRWELLVGERYGIKAVAIAERRRLDEEDSSRRRGLLVPGRKVC